jgi:hypothetical protein
MAYEDEVLADLPLIYWRLDETSGTTAADSSGNGNDGTIVERTAASLSPVFASSFGTSEAIYANARDGLGGTPFPASLSIGQNFTGSVYECYEYFVAFDCSAITVTPTSVQLLYQIFWTSFFGSLSAPYNVKVAILDTGSTTADASDWKTGSELAALTVLNTTASSGPEGIQITVDIDPNVIPLGGSIRFIFWGDNQEGAGVAPTGSEHSALFVNVLEAIAPLTGAYTLGVTGLLSGDPDKAINLANTDTAQVLVESGSWPGTDLILNAFSIEIIVNIDDLRHAWGYAFLAGVFGPESSVDIELFTGSDFANDFFGFYIYGDSSATASDYLAAPVVAGTTYHLVLRYNGLDGAELYVNGTLVSQQSLPFENFTIFNGSPFRVGCDGWGGGDGVAGTLDEAAFYGYSLDPDRILAHYNAMSGPTAPGAPTGVSATAGNASAAVSWTAPASDGGSTIIDYSVTVYNSAGGGATGVTGATTRLVGSATTGFLFTGLTNGTVYKFRVAAVNAIGTGTQSALSAGVTPNLGANLPSAPLSVGGVAGDTEITVSWTVPVSNGGSAITDYSVRVFNAAGGAAAGVTGATTRLAGSATTTFLFTGLTNGTVYRFRVAALNVNGTGPLSALSAGVIPTPVITPPPGSGAKVSWYFTDLATSTEYIFEVNPNAGGSPLYQKNIAARTTLAAGGKQLVYQGTQIPSSFEWSGVLLNQEQHDMFTLWWEYRHQIQVTDDLQRTFYIYISDYTPERQRAAHSPHKRSYTMKATALDWA